MVERRRRKRERKSGNILQMLLICNIIPLAVLAVLGVLWLRGEIEFTELPQGMTLNLGVLGAGLVLLLLIASFSLPVTHQAVKRCEGFMAHRKAILGGSAEGSRFASLLLLPLTLPFYLLGLLTRLVLLLLSLLLIAIVLAFTARLFEPEFLAEPIQKILEYRL